MSRETPSKTNLSATDMGRTLLVAFRRTKRPGETHIDFVLLDLVTSQHQCRFQVLQDAEVSSDQVPVALTIKFDGPLPISTLRWRPPRTWRPRRPGTHTQEMEAHMQQFEGFELHQYAESVINVAATSSALMGRKRSKEPEEVKELR